MRFLALSLVFWLSFTSHSDAAQTGQDLIGLCENEAPEVQGICMGYIIAVGDTLTQFSNDGGYFLGYRSCMPEITVVQAREVVVNFLNEHPDRLDRGAFSLVVRALSEAFPCQ